MWVGHVTLRGHDESRELLECPDCGTLHEVQELRDTLTAFEEELKGALCPAIAELAMLRNQRLTRLENLHGDIRKKLTTPEHWLNHMVLNALVTVSRDTGEVHIPTLNPELL